MGMFDRIKNLAGKKSGKLDDVVEKVGDVVDDRTGHNHSDKINTAEEKAKDLLDDLDDKK